MSGTTTSRSFSVIFVETANSINMLSHSVTPMAYKSLSTLAQAIFPKNQELIFVSKSLCLPCQCHPVPTLHVGILNKWVEKIRGLNQRQASMSQRSDG